MTRQVGNYLVAFAAVSAPLPNDAWGELTRLEFDEMCRRG